MRVSGDGHLEGACSLSRYFMQICIISGYFLGTLAEMGHIHREGKRMVLLAFFGTFCGDFFVLFQ